MVFNRFGTGPLVLRIKLFLTVLCLALIAGCSYHPPAPIEEHSAGIVKRQLNSDGSYYVRAGDTLYAIAFGYGLDAKDVAQWNGISSPYVIYPGQILQLSAPFGGRKEPGSDAVKISAIKPPAETSTRAVTKPVQAEQKQSPIKQSPIRTSEPVQAATETADIVIPPKPPIEIAADPESWKWPTRGQVRRAYVAGDPARNGLDIAGKEGQPIVASSAGQVVYSGNGLIGYGELIIIKHSEKMLSAYAHNKVRMAHEGDKVSAGQKIAEMGRNSAGEQILHFEIRTRGKPVNPLNYLPEK